MLVSAATGFLSATAYSLSNQLWNGKHESFQKLFSKYRRKVAACVHSTQGALHIAERAIVQLPCIISQMLCPGEGQLELNS
jgi:hypothetical protein